MKCKATIKRFWNGVMVGPGTGNETVDYKGKKGDMEELGFTEITKAVADADAAAIEKERLESEESSKGLLLHEYTNPPKDLPTSGGTDIDEKDQAKSADEIAHEIRGGSKTANEVVTQDKKGTKVDRPHENASESADQKKVAKDEDGKPITSVSGGAADKLES